MTVPRRLLAATAAVTVLASGGTAWVLVADRPAPAPEQGGAAPDRFLRLTGDGPDAAAHEDAGEAVGVRAAAASAVEVPCQRHPATVASLPNGWCLSPAGRSVDVLRFPLGLLPTSNGKVVVSSSSGGVQGLTVVDQQDLSTTRTTAGNLFIGLAETPDQRVYAAGGNANRVFRYRWAGDSLQSQDLTQDATFPLHNGLDGTLGRFPVGSQVLPAVDGVRVTTYPGQLARFGKLVVAAGTLSEASGGACPDKQQVCGRVSVIDPTTDTVLGRAAVGMDPYGLAVDPVRKRLYVTNWADEAGRGRGVGTVSTVDVSDPAKPRELAWTRVGHHPSAVVLSADRRRLFVANTNDDSLSVLDVTGRPRVVATESVRPLPGLPVGAHPDAMVLAPDGKTLFVALAGMNAVEVRDGRTGARVAGRPMYIPTGWYPSALAVTGSAKAYRLWIANAKGTGPAPGYNGSVLFNGSVPSAAGAEAGGTNGSVTVVDLPAPARTANAWTEAVVRNDDLDTAMVSPCAPNRGVRISQVLCPPPGTRSPIKHVVYVVTENKTFDQYFGDLPAGDGGYRADPSYLLYGREVTANHHALVDAGYSLGDNFFSDGEVSVTGHSWTSGAMTTDHNERTWPADYDEGLRGNHGNGDPLKSGLADQQGAAIAAAENELDDPEGGYIFEAFKRAGATPPSDRPGRLSMAIYGESTARESGNMDAYKAPGWKDGDISYSDSCRVLTFRDGVAPDGPSPAFGAGGAPAGVHTNDCDGRKLASAFSLKHWTDVYRRTGRDIMPSFIYMSLPQNHTLATNVGSPTPQSMVADNDYAVGLLVEALSKSPFWASTAVLQTEDDTQVAGDHVSPLRDYLQVSSPWAQPGPNHQWGSMPALLRTVEQIFGIPPISLYDRLAMPMHEAFLPSLSMKPNLKPYTAVRPAVPFRVNEPGAVGADLSASLDFSTYDRVDEQLLNAILYAQARGTKLLLP